MTTRYSCPQCTNKVGVTVKLTEPPRCVNFEAHGGSRKYVAMVEEKTAIQKQLEELL